MSTLHASLEAHPTRAARHEIHRNGSGLRQLVRIFGVNPVPFGGGSGDFTCRAIANCWAAIVNTSATDTTATTAIDVTA